TGVIVGVFGAAVPYVLVAWGERHIDSGTTAVANATAPLFVALLAIRILPGERATGLRLVGVLLGLLGVALLAGLHPVGGRSGAAGTIAVVVAAASYARASLYAQGKLALGGLVLATGAMVWG